MLVFYFFIYVRNSVNRNKIKHKNAVLSIKKKVLYDAADPTRQNGEVWRIFIFYLDFKRLFFGYN